MLFVAMRLLFLCFFFFFFRLFNGVWGVLWDFYVVFGNGVALFVFLEMNI